MTKSLSFSKYENESLPRFRDLMNQAESTEDVRKFFSQAMRELMTNISQGELDIGRAAMLLDPDQPGGWSMIDELAHNPNVRAYFTDSDLAVILGRFAATAVKRLRRLEKNPQKTEAKMYPTKDGHTR